MGQGTWKTELIKVDYLESFVAGVMGAIGAVKDEE